jgi:ribosomal protein S27E
MEVICRYCGTTQTVAERHADESCTTCGSCALRSTRDSADEKERITRAHVEFDEPVAKPFCDLLIQTIEQSEFMDTKWQDDVLVVYEVVDTSQQCSTVADDSPDSSEVITDA